MVGLTGRDGEPMVVAGRRTRAAAPRRPADGAEQEGRRRRSALTPAPEGTGRTPTYGTVWSRRKSDIGLMLPSPPPEARLPGPGRQRAVPGGSGRVRPEYGSGMTSMPTRRRAASLRVGLPGARDETSGARLRCLRPAVRAPGDARPASGSLRCVLINRSGGTGTAAGRPLVALGGAGEANGWPEAWRLTGSVERLRQ